MKGLLGDFAHTDGTLQGSFIEGLCIHTYIHCTLKSFFPADMSCTSQKPYTEEASQCPCVEEAPGNPKGFAHTEGALQSPFHVHRGLYEGFVKPLGILVGLHKILATL